MKSALRQRGFGIAETMVAAAVGMVLTLMACGLLLASNADYTRNAASTRMDDNGRFALALLSQAIRQANVLSGLDAASVSRSSEGIAHPLAASVNGSDVLATRFTSDGSMLDCAGFTVAAGEGWSIFYVAIGADGEPELRCKYKGEHGWSADAVVRGVDSFQLLYGVDTSTPRDVSPNRYLPAAAINASPDAAALWRRVVTVQAALLLRGEAGSRSGSLPTKYVLLPGATLDEKDLPKAQQLRVRRVFTTTVARRNH